MLYSGRSSCIRYGWLIFSKCGCIRAKVVVFGQKWLHSCNVVVIGESGCTRAKMVVFGQRYFSSGKVVELGQK